MTRFDTPAPIRARIEIGWGDIRVTGRATGASTVEVEPTDPANEKDRRAAEQIRVTCADGRLDVVDPRYHAIIGPTKRTGSVQITVVVPEGSAVQARTALGAIATEGALAEVSVRTSAGDVHVAEATAADVRSYLGAVAVGRVSGDLRATIGSGALTVEQVGGQALVKNSNGDTWIGRSGTSTRVKAANGDVAVEVAGGDVMATSSNGSLRVGRASQGSLMLHTSLGSIVLGVEEGTAARLELRTGFGRVSNGLEASSAPAAGERALVVDAQTSAGDITVVRALPVEA